MISYNVFYQLFPLCDTSLTTRKKERVGFKKKVKGYVRINVRLQESYFSLRVTFIQSYLVEKKHSGLVMG